MPRTLHNSLKYLVAISFLICGSARSHSLVCDDYVVATVNPIASDAAAGVFEQGGNAIDAALAAALTLSVVDGHNSGIGGGCLILIRKADGQFVAIDGRECAPAAASRDMFLENGKANPMLSQLGPLAVGVPGALAAYQKALDDCGSGALDLKRLLEPGRRAAEEGFAIDEQMASAIAKYVKEIGQFEATREVFLHEDGSALQVGDRVVQPDLARTYASLQEHGIDWFYRGEFAEKIAKYMKDHGGLVTASDMANYKAVQREPIVSCYRGHTIVGFPPPSSGGVHVAQVLNMLENFDLAAMHQTSPTSAWHVVAESFSRAFADRAHWLGDADFVKVPRGIADKNYAKELAGTISLERAVAVAQHGQPPQWRQDIFGRHTTHIATADSAGNWVAITATVNTSFGSKVIVPGTGVVLNNEMDDFSIHPGTPNAFGLIGAENNSIAPGKRPLSSMSPTIVLDEQQQPVLAVGAAGGPKIITQVLQAIIRVIDLGQTIDQAIAAPRIHHQWRPNQLAVESTVSMAEREAYAAKGHAIFELEAAGVTQAIMRTPDKRLQGVSDPRASGKVSGK